MAGRETLRKINLFCLFYVVDHVCLSILARGTTGQVCVVCRSRSLFRKPPPTLRSYRCLAAPRPCHIRDDPYPYPVSGWQSRGCPERAVCDRLGCCFIERA